MDDLSEETVSLISWKEEGSASSGSLRDCSAEVIRDSSASNSFESMELPLSIPFRSFSERVCSDELQTFMIPVTRDTSISFFSFFPGIWLLMMFVKIA